jgi:hypothetical protein
MMAFSRASRSLAVVASYPLHDTVPDIFRAFRFRTARAVHSPPPRGLHSAPVQFGGGAVGASTA